ncbi:MAG: hypothetical protein HYU41_03295 [Candidatus Rokubacteria bacterium]|nr:hypothetical protein [Candidatus Rokubacteria bacterium]
MLHVTERAKEYLLEKKLSASIHNTNVGLRLASVAGGQLALVADSPKAGDQIVTHKESTVLLVDAELSGSILAGRTVDCKKTESGRLEVVVTRRDVSAAQPQ